MHLRVRVRVRACPQARHTWSTAVRGHATLVTELAALTRVLNAHAIPVRREILAITISPGCAHASAVPGAQMLRVRFPVAPEGA